MEICEKTAGLFAAVGENDIEAVKASLSDPVNIDAKFGFCEETPLHLSSKNGNKEIVELLLSSGASVDERNKFGKTALHFAIGRCDPDLERVLIDAGADVGTRDGSGQTLLHEAAKKNNGQAVEYLTDQGVDVNAKDQFGSTPLHCVAEGNQGDSHLTTIRELLKRGADPLALDEKFNAPLAYLVREPKWEVTKLFTDHMRQARSVECVPLKVIRKVDSKPSGNVREKEVEGHEADGDRASKGKKSSLEEEISRGVLTIENLFAVLKHFLLLLAGILLYFLSEYLTSTS